MKNEVSRTRFECVLMTNKYVILIDTNNEIFQVTLNAHKNNNVNENCERDFSTNGLSFDVFRISLRVLFFPVRFWIAVHTLDKATKYYNNIYYKWFSFSLCVRIFVYGCELNLREWIWHQFVVCAYIHYSCVCLCVRLYGYQHTCNSRVTSIN